MKSFLSLILAATLLLSLSACGNSANTPEVTQSPKQTTSPIETTVPATLPTFEEVANPVTFFSLSLGEDYNHIRSITVYANEDGSAYVEYVGDVKKVADMDPIVFHGIAAALGNSGLAELNGKDAWGEGEANGSMYIEFADASYIAVGFNGDIPEAYIQGYAVMDAFFAKLTADVPVYIPKPIVMGEVDPDLLDMINSILDGSGIQALDSFTISQVALDEHFTHTMGLTGTEGISSGVSLAPIMMTSAYSLVIVTTDGGVDTASVCSSFEEGMNWTKWVCVAPSNALIATKDNMVLCLMAGGDLYTQTAAGVAAAGWTTVKTLENPNF